MTEPFKSRTSGGNERLSTQRILSAAYDSMEVTGGPRRYPIGYLSEGGGMVREFVVIPGATLVPSSSNFYTFQPVLIRQDTGSAKQLGSPRSTQRLGMTSGVAFRLHEEAALSERIAGTSVLAVDILVTGTTTGSAILVKPVFQVEYAV